MIAYYNHIFLFVPWNLITIKDNLPKKILFSNLFKCYFDITPSSKIETIFFPCCTVYASAYKISQVKTKDGVIGTFPTLRPFEGFLFNSPNNIQTLHRTLW